MLAQKEWKGEIQRMRTLTIEQNVINSRDFNTNITSYLLETFHTFSFFRAHKHFSHISPLMPFFSFFFFHIHSSFDSSKPPNLFLYYNWVNNTLFQHFLLNKIFLLSNKINNKHLNVLIKGKDKCLGLK